jgi:hypothetical protein
MTRRRRCSGGCFSVPWAPDERVEAFRAMTPQQLLQQPRSSRPSSTAAISASSTAFMAVRSPRRNPRSPNTAIQPLRRRNRNASTARARRRWTVCGVRDGCQSDGFRTPSHLDGCTAARPLPLRRCLCDRHVPVVLEPPKNPDPLSPELVTSGGAASSIASHWIGSCRRER